MNLIRCWQNIFAQLKVAREFLEYLGHERHDTGIRRVADLIISRSREAGAAWGNFVTYSNKLTLASRDAQMETRAQDKAVGNLSALLEGARISNEAELAQTMNPHELHECSYCGRLSARARKCRGCGQAR